MLKARFEKYILLFRNPAKTSRNTLTQKPSWFITIEDSNEGISGIGECSLFPGLSPDNPDFYETKLSELVLAIHKNQTPDPAIDLTGFPSIRFGLETANHDLKNGGKKLIFKNDFYSGKMSIPINGLVWMGNFDFMKKQLYAKLKAGFDCIKIKVGAFDFEEEYRFLKTIRKEYGKDIREMRLDANGAFNPGDALLKLNRLSELDIHSIEQPIRAGQWEQMAELCSKSPIPIALDEELTGITSTVEKRKMLAEIKPAYIILKPSLTGGFNNSDEWISIAEQNNIDWWATSALESNIGLNAIAQWCANYKIKLPQGLGTGGLYLNNINSPLEVLNNRLHYRSKIEWEDIC